MLGLTDLLFAATVVGFYPAMVLMVAITGPHNETEKRELMEQRLSLSPGEPK